MSGNTKYAQSDTKGRRTIKKHMILIRYILISIIGYLIIRSFINFGKEGRSSSRINKTDRKNNMPPKKVSKEIGEYIDYEEIKK